MTKHENSSGNDGARVYCVAENETSADATDTGQATSRSGQASETAEDDTAYGYAHQTGYAEKAEGWLGHYMKQRGTCNGSRPF